MHLHDVLLSFSRTFCLFSAAEGEEERSIMKGVVNLAFQEETEGGMHNNTLEAKCQNMELPAAATFRGKASVLIVRPPVSVMQV